MAQAARGVLTGGAWGSDAAGSGRCVGVTRSKSESESESDRASRVPGFPWRRGAIKPGRRSASPPRSVRFCSSVDSRHPDRSLLYFDRERQLASPSTTRAPACCEMGAGDRHLMKRKLQLQGMSASDGMLLKKTRRSEEEGYGILEASKEAVAAVRLMRFKHIPGGLDIWMDHWLEMKAKMAAEEEEAIKNKKRKRVVKRRVPKALIDHMVAWPFGSANILTPVQLAKRSLERRRYYALSSFIEAKLRAYQQALIRQYNALGYAEDEIEVTDSEEEEEN